MGSFYSSGRTLRRLTALAAGLLLGNALPGFVLNARAQCGTCSKTAVAGTNVTLNAGETFCITTGTTYSG